MMKYLSLFCLLLGAAFCTAEDDSAVLVLDEDNFASQLAENDVLLVEFYAPWCGHCKKLAPEYDAAAAVLLKEDPPIRIAKVDCTENKEICSKHGVSGYPTIKLFRDGVVLSDFDGGRDSAGIVSYMKKKAGPMSYLLETLESAHTYINRDRPEPAIVGFFEKEDSDSHKAFAKAAASMEGFTFGHSFDAEINKKYGHKNKVVIYRPDSFKNKFEECEIVHDGSDLEPWLKKNIFGLAGVLTESNGDYFPKPLVTVYYTIDFKLNPKGTQYWRNRVMKVAKKLSGKGLTFAVADRGIFSRTLPEFGLSGDTSQVEPAVTVLNAKSEKFAMKEKFSMDTFEKFLNSYLAGEVEIYMKSEDVPESNDEPVKVIVAKNFNEIVNDPTKDVLIEFYAPWCGHCKSLEPKYKELAEKLAGEPNLVIAKMDATANDVPSVYEVQGFPTIFFSPKNSKDSPKKYQGGREIDQFIKYLADEEVLTTVDGKGKKLNKVEL